MPADDFDVMVHEIVRVTLKYEGRVTPTIYELEMLRRQDTVEREQAATLGGASDRHCRSM